MIPRYSRAEMQSIWSDESRFKLWLEIEVLAMEAMAKEGIIPESAPGIVREKGSFDIERIHELDEQLKHDVIAFLTNVSEYVGDAGKYVHYGMTSSDLIDTAFSVQLVQAADLILSGLSDLKNVLKKRAKEHKDTLCMGRTHGIHAEPTTFGLKLAGFYAELNRQEQRIKQAREEMSVGAISGPVGAYSQLPPSIEAYVCEKLGLKPVSVSTQVIPRDLHANLFLSFSLLASCLEHLSTEIRHLQRTEVREVEEFFSKGQKGSSAMPHKRNPVLSENMTGLARVVRSMACSSLENIPLWHERDISHSSIERVIAPDITITLDFMLHRMTKLVDNMLVYPERMKQNIDSTKGLTFSASVLLFLTEKGITREAAYDIVQRNAMRVWESVNSDSPLSFYEELINDKEVMKLVTSEELEHLFSLDRFTENVDFIFSRVFE